MQNILVFRGYNITLYHKVFFILLNGLVTIKLLFYNRSCIFKSFVKVLVIESGVGFYNIILLTSKSFSIFVIYQKKLFFTTYVQCIRIYLGHYIGNTFSKKFFLFLKKYIWNCFFNHSFEI